MPSPIQILASHEGQGPLSASDLTSIGKLAPTLAHDKRVDAVYSGWLPHWLRRVLPQISLE